MTNLNKIGILSLVVGLILTPSLIGLVKANSSPVSVAITASPSTICVGQSSHLTWSSLNATNVSIDQGIGSVPLNGDRHVSPSQTTIYTVTGSNSGDSGTTSVTVFVNNCGTPTPTPTPTPSQTPVPTPSHTHTPTPTVLPVSVAITASPSTICDGQSSQITWSSLNATSVSLNQGIGSVSLNGSRHVSPSRTAIYTVTGSNSG